MCVMPKSLLYYFSFVAFLLSLAGTFSACSDDDSSAEFLLNREISDLSVIRECDKDADSGAYCFKVRFRYPIDTDKLKKVYIWVDDDVVGDTAKTVNEDKLAKATTSFEYASGSANLFDTVDVTPYIQDFVAERCSLLVAFYCEYSSGRPGSVQRVYLHFCDDMDPSLLGNLRDSVWTTGIRLRWLRPTDQTVYYKPNELSGPILGYNIVLHTDDKDEDLRDLKLRVETPDGVDSTGGTLFKRHARYYSNNDSVWVDTVAHSADSKKNELRIAIFDGKGYNVDNSDSNEFRLIIEGLRAESEYSVGYSSWDTSGNYSGTDGNAAAYELISTTDSVAPLMATKLYIVEDTLYPGMARLDSNNHLRIFWNRSIDPYTKQHGVVVDSILYIPDSCLYSLCYDTVKTYMVEYWDGVEKQWVAYSKKLDESGRYGIHYGVSADTFAVSTVGTFVADTIRWVAPGDTLILRIRSVDKSGYFSAALIDTVYVSPGALAKELECPEGFVAVQASDTLKFCMERTEHRNDSGAFVTNVLHSEAVAACEAISASGFKVSLCNERDWELVCLSGGTLAYGVIQDTLEMTDVLFRDCNVATNDSSPASDITLRNPHCMNPMGVRDLPGQYQEWAMGRSEDTSAVIKGGSYLVLSGIDLETQALCTRRSFPVYTRLAYTTDSIYLYREGTKVDTVFKADTSRTLYKVLTQKDFKDSLQFFDVQDSNGNSIGTDYSLYSEYKKGGEEWLEKIGNGMKYVPDHIEVVFLTGERISYRGAANFYRSPSIGFRCCAYKDE